MEPTVQFAERPVVVKCGDNLSIEAEARRLRLCNELGLTSFPLLILTRPGELVMEKVETRPLGDIPPSRRQDAFRLAVRDLARLHKQGLDHGDLHEKNVVWDPVREAIQILDLGDGVEVVGAAGHAPEKALGLRGPASDVYEIAVLIDRHIKPSGNLRRTVNKALQHSHDARPCMADIEKALSGSTPRRWQWVVAIAIFGFGLVHAIAPGSEFADIKRLASRKDATSWRSLVAAWTTSDPVRRAYIQKALEGFDRPVYPFTPSNDPVFSFGMPFIATEEGAASIGDKIVLPNGVTGTVVDISGRVVTINTGSKNRQISLPDLDPFGTTADYDCNVYAPPGNNIVKTLEAYSFVYDYNMTGDEKSGMIAGLYNFQNKNDFEETMSKLGVSIEGGDITFLTELPLLAFFSGDFNHNMARQILNDAGLKMPCEKTFQFYVRETNIKDVIDSVCTEEK